MPLNELKPKSLESIIEAWTSTEKTEKTHHEHGGLLCFLAVNSACVMTKELFILNKRIRVCFGASDNQLTFRAHMLSFVD